MARKSSISRLPAEIKSYIEAMLATSNDHATDVQWQKYIGFDRMALADTVIGNGAEITCRTDYESHQLSWGESITLYRCDGGAVGLGRNENVHGPVTLGRTHLPDPRLRERIEELAELWGADTALTVADG